MALTATEGAGKIRAFPVLLKSAKGVGVARAHNLLSRRAIYSIYYTRIL